MLLNKKKKKDLKSGGMPESIKAEEAPIPHLSKEEALSLSNFIDNYFVSSLKDCKRDSIKYIRNIISAYDKLCAYSGFSGTNQTATDIRKERVKKRKEKRDVWNKWLY